MGDNNVSLRREDNEIKVTVRNIATDNTSERNEVITEMKTQEEENIKLELSNNVQTLDLISIVTHTLTEKEVDIDCQNREGDKSQVIHLEEEQNASKGNEEVNHEIPDVEEADDKENQRDEILTTEEKFTDVLSVEDIKTYPNEIKTMIDNTIDDDESHLKEENVEILMVEGKENIGFVSDNSLKIEDPDMKFHEQESKGELDKISHLKKELSHEKKEIEYSSNILTFKSDNETLEKTECIITKEKDIEAHFQKEKIFTDV